MNEFEEAIEYDRRQLRLLAEWLPLSVDLGGFVHYRRLCRLADEMMGVAK